MSEYVVDVKRFEDAISGHLTQTGIFVLSKLNDKLGNYDIAVLTKESLLAWLRSRDNVDSPDVGAGWREQVIMVIFGHDR